MANADLFALSCHLYNRSQGVVCGLKNKKNGALDGVARTAPSRSNFSRLAFMLSLNSECGMLQRDIGSGKRLEGNGPSLCGALVVFFELLTLGNHDLNITICRAFKGLKTRRHRDRAENK
jgi:hypothetical protein